MDDLLRTLPKERAGEEFTSRVVRRLDETPGKKPTRLVFAAAVVVVLVAVAGIFFYQQAEKAKLREEIATLRAEYQALSLELQRETGVHPVVYLGGDGRTDYVLDMSKLMRLRKESSQRIPIRYTGGPI
jgi:hypothetical protein